MGNAEEPPHYWQLQIDSVHNWWWIVWVVFLQDMEFGLCLYLSATDRPAAEPGNGDGDVSALIITRD